MCACVVVRQRRVRSVQNVVCAGAVTEFLGKAGFD